MGASIFGRAAIFCATVGAIHRARLPTYCTLGDVEKLLPRAVATGPFAESTATVVRKAA